MQIKTYRAFSLKQKSLYQEILNLTMPVGETYPAYVKWYRQTFLKGLQQGERGIITASDQGRLLGVALFKDTVAEKKLCTLFVHPDFRKKGIASHLLKVVIQELGEKPLVSVSENNLPQVESLFQKMGFGLSAHIKGAYRSERTEYYFNDKKQNAIQKGLIPVLLKRMRQLKK